MFSFRCISDVCKQKADDIILNNNYSYNDKTPVM